VQNNVRSIFYFGSNKIQFLLPFKNKGCDRFLYCKCIIHLSYRGIYMFGLFSSNPVKKMRKKYDKLLEDGMHAQRRGDIKSYAMLTAEAETLWDQIQKLEKEKPAS